MAITPLSRLHLPNRSVSCLSVLSEITCFVVPVGQLLSRFGSHGLDNSGRNLAFLFLLVAVVYTLKVAWC